MSTHTTLGTVARRVSAAACVLAAGHAFADAPEVAEDWLATAQRDIEAREYHASQAAGALQAPNRAHNLRTWFEPTGIRVHDRTAQESPKLLGLALVGIGRGDSLAAVGPGRVASREARAEISREGLLEWYENSAAGLEQGFTLAERPTGTGPLALELAVQGASASLHGDAVVFATQAGRTLRYDHLVATDATGEALVARLAVPAPQRVRIQIEDAGAKYPLTIDPLLTQTADAQLEANQISTLFGASVASAGDVNGDGFADVIVGATEYDAGQFNEGAAFVFLGSASGIASAGAGAAAARLESDQASAYFGGSVAGAGDVNGDGYDDVIVGATEYDAGTTSGGSVFIFLAESDGSGIANNNAGAAATHLESVQSNGGFGRSATGAGDVNGDGYADVIVGAPNYSLGESAEGAAFVFLGSATGIASGNSSTAATQLQSNQTNSYFGTAVSTTGDGNGDGFDDVIVGAWRYTAGESIEGAAFVFYGSGSGVPSGSASTANVQLESNQGNSAFGKRVASAGDVNGDGRSDVVVGAELYDSGETDEGAVFVFLGGMGATGNPTNASIRIESNHAGSNFGSSVAGAGDVNGDGYADFIVGSILPNNGESFEGRAFVFLGGAGGFNGDLTSAYASLESNQGFAFFGGSVAGAGDVNGDGFSDVIVGAQQYEAGEMDEGAAFVYLGGNAGMVDGNLDTVGGHAAVFQSTSGGDLGYRVVSAGDVNGDGFGDIAMSAPQYDAGSGPVGAVFVFHGSALGIGSQPLALAATQIYGSWTNGRHGHDVAAAGDVDGDGYGDLIVGTPLAGGGTGGTAAVYYGSSTGLTFSSTSPEAIAAFQPALLGSGVAGAGDVNGDGFADVIVAAPAYDVTQTDEGAVFIFHGSASGLGTALGLGPADASGRIVSGQSHAYLGASGLYGSTLQAFPVVGAVAGAGDVNGDGYADVIVGASGYDSGEADEGAAFVFHGSATGIGQRSPANADARLESNQTTALLGDVAAAGDVNRDGYGDVIVGARWYDAGQPDEGAAFVFLGSSGGVVSSGDPGNANARLESDQTYAELRSVASAGDVNGDGYADVIVGASNYSSGEAAEGAAFVFLGSAGIANGNPATAAAQLESNAVYGSMGASVSSAGDVNGDGFSDVLAGATGTSQVGLFHGNGKAGGNIGRQVRVRQLRGDGSGTAVQPWGLSNDASAFQVRMDATHPGGRGRVKLQVEACSNGTPFGDQGCSTFTGPSWTDVGAVPIGVVLDQALSGLAQSTLYRWRARVLYAPFHVTEPNITPPPNPSHGPWRRLAAQSAEADIRIGLPDSDDDGVPDELEEAGPNGGDGDGDGTADALQTFVASLPDATTSQYVSVAVSGGCATLGSVQTLTELQAGPDDPAYGYPRGLVRVTLPCVIASVKIFYHGAPSPVPPYRKFGPTTPGVPATAQWYGFPGATFGSQLVGGVPVATVTLALADGALGDATGVDGVIVDPGGPAVQVIPALGMPAMVTLALLLGASAAGALRMRRR
jgi:hypothetical protein